MLAIIRRAAFCRNHQFGCNTERIAGFVLDSYRR
jgi:hypothetical protein